MKNVLFIRVVETNFNFCHERDIFQVEEFMASLAVTGPCIAEFEDFQKNQKHFRGRGADESSNGVDKYFGQVLWRHGEILNQLQKKG